LKAPPFSSYTKTIISSIKKQSQSDYASNTAIRGSPITPPALTTLLCMTPKVTTEEGRVQTPTTPEVPTLKMRSKRYEETENHP